MPPQAARNADAPETVTPVAPSRRMNSRREAGAPLAIRSNRRSRSSDIRLVPLTVYDEGLVRPPGELDLAARPQRLAAVGVLLDDDELLAAGRGDHVLQGRAEEARDADVAAQHVG